MKKINLTKKIIAGVLAFVVLLNIGLSAFNKYEQYKFKDWIYNSFGAGSTDQKLKIDEPGIVYSIILIALTLIIWGIFIGLAMKYSFAKSHKVQGRKWPYIVMLIFSSIAAAFGVWGLFNGSGRVVDLDSNVPSDVVAAVDNKFDDSYKVLIKVLTIAGLVIDVLIATLTIVALVYIGKAKTIKDMQMSDEVIQTGIDEKAAQVENDLP